MSFPISKLTLGFWAVRSVPSLSSYPYSLRPFPYLVEYSAQLPDPLGVSIRSIIFPIPFPFCIPSLPYSPPPFFLETSPQPQQKEMSICRTAVHLVQLPRFLFFNVPNLVPRDRPEPLEYPPIVQTARSPPLSTSRVKLSIHTSPFPSVPPILIFSLRRSQSRDVVLPGPPGGLHIITSFDLHELFFLCVLFLPKCVFSPVFPFLFAPPPCPRPSVLPPPDRRDMFLIFRLPCRTQVF